MVWMKMSQELPVGQVGSEFCQSLLPYESMTFAYLAFLPPGESWTSSTHLLGATMRDVGQWRLGLVRVLFVLVHVLVVVLLLVRAAVIVALGHEVSAVGGHLSARPVAFAILGRVPLRRRPVVHTALDVLLRLLFGHLLHGLLDGPGVVVYLLVKQMRGSVGERGEAHGVAQVCNDAPLLALRTVDELTQLRERFGRLVGGLQVVLLLGEKPHLGREAKSVHLLAVGD